MQAAFLFRDTSIFYLSLQTWTPEAYANDRITLKVIKCDFVSEFTVVSFKVLDLYFLI